MNEKLQLAQSDMVKVGKTIRHLRVRDSVMPSAKGRMDSKFSADAHTSMLLVPEGVWIDYKGDVAFVPMGNIVSVQI